MEENVANAFDRFLQQPGRATSTKAKYRYKFKLFLQKHGHQPVDHITAETIADWFTYLEDVKGYSEGHLAFHRSCHITFWNWLGLAIVTIPRYSEAPAVIIAASDKEIHQLLATCERMWSTIQQQRDAAIIALGTAGLRRSNIRFVRTNEAKYVLSNPVSVGGRSYCILHTKGKEPMDAVLDEQRAAIVRRYLSNRPPTYHHRLFINLNEHNGHYLKPLSNEGLINARRRVCTAAGLRLVTFQEMRRWLGTKVARDKNIQIAAKALGHKSGVAVMLKHYYNPEKILAQTAVLDAYQD